MKQEKARTVYFVCVADGADKLDRDGSRRRWTRALQEGSRFDRIKAEMDEELAKPTAAQEAAAARNPKDRSGLVGKEGMTSEEVEDAVDDEVKKISSGLGMRKSRRMSIEMNERTAAALLDALDEEEDEEEDGGGAPLEEDSSDAASSQTDEEEEGELSLQDKIEDALDPGLTNLDDIRGLLRGAEAAGGC